MPPCQSPHPPILYPAHRAGLLDLVAYLAYEAACALGLHAHGCIGLGVFETTAGWKLIGAANDGKDFSLDFYGGRLEFNDYPIDAALRERLEEELEAFGSKKAKRSFLHGAKGHKPNWWEEFELEDKLKNEFHAKGMTAMQHYQLLDGLLKGAEHALKEAVTEESKRYSQLLSKGVKAEAKEGATKHAEMRVLEAMDKLGAQPISAYIATDKVCCYSCFYMLRPYLEARGIPAAFGAEAPIMGTHGHIFANWKAPEVPQRYVDTEVACGMCCDPMLASQLGATIEKWNPSLGNTGLETATLKVQNADFIEVLDCYGLKDLVAQG